MVLVTSQQEQPTKDPQVQNGDGCDDNEANIRTMKRKAGDDEAGDNSSNHRNNSSGSISTSSNKISRITVDQRIHRHSQPQGHDHHQPYGNNCIGNHNRPRLNNDNPSELSRRILPSRMVQDNDNSRRVRFSRHPSSSSSSMPPRGFLPRHKNSKPTAAPTTTILPVSMKTKYPPMFSNLVKRESIVNRTLIVNNVPHGWTAEKFNYEFNSTLKLLALRFREPAVVRVNPAVHVSGQMSVEFYNAAMATRSINTLDGYPIREKLQLSIQRPKTYAGLSSKNERYGFKLIDKDARGRVTQNQNIRRTIRIRNVPSSIPDMGLKNYLKSACIQRNFSGLDPDHLITDLHRKENHAFVTFRTEEEAFVAAIELNTINLLGSYVMQIKRCSDQVPKLLVGHYRGPMPATLVTQNLKEKKKNRDDTSNCQKKKSITEQPMNKMSTTTTEAELKQLKAELEKERMEKAAVEADLLVVTLEHEEKKKEVGTKLEQLEIKLEREQKEKATVEENLMLVTRERDEKDREVELVKSAIGLLEVQHSGATTQLESRPSLLLDPVKSVKLLEPKLEDKDDDDIPTPDPVESSSLCPSSASSSAALEKAQEQRYPFIAKEYKCLRKWYLEPREVDITGELRNGRIRKKKIIKAAIDVNTPNYRNLKKEIQKLDTSNNKSKHQRIYVLLKWLSEYEMKPWIGFPQVIETTSGKKDRDVVQAADLIDLTTMTTSTTSVSDTDTDSTSDQEEVL